MKYPAPIETARLIARPLTMGDATAWERFLGDEEATRYFPVSDDPLAVRAHQWMERQLNRYADGQFGLMALVRKSDGVWIGQCGLLRQEVDGLTELEVGYHIFPEHWLQGYASEAAIAFRDFAFEQELAPSIISIIDRENIGSQKVALRNGMRREKACTFRGLDVYVYRVSRSEWIDIQGLAR